MYTARQLTAPAERSASRILLHRIYIHQMGWVLPKQNPSGLSIVPSQHIQGQLELVDIYAESSIVLGLFCQTNLVGTLRLVMPVEGRLEVERYHLLPPPLNTPGSKLIEVNRLAVEPEHQQSAGPVHLIREAVTVAAKLRPNFLITAAMKPQPYQLCADLGFEASENCLFRYNASDPEPVQLMHIDASRKGSLDRIINVCDRILNT